jgi:hypothetical protein
MSNKFIKKDLLLVQDILCPKKPCFKKGVLKNFKEDDEVYYCATREKKGCPEEWCPPSAEAFGMILMMHRYYYKRYMVKSIECPDRVCFKPKKILLGYSKDGGNPFETICEHWLEHGCPDWEEKPKPAKTKKKKQ